MPGDGRSKGSGTLFIILTLLGWASVPLFLKYFVPYIDAWTANGWRYGVSALFWSPVLLVWVWRGRLPQGLWKAAVLPSTFNCLGQVGFALCPYYIDPGLMAFLLRFQIILVAFGAYFLFPGERRVLRSRMYWAGIILVFLGSTGTILLGHHPPRGTTALGVTLAVLAGLLFGCYALAVRYCMVDMGSIPSFAAISQYTAAVMVGLMLLVGRKHGAEALGLTWGGLAMLVASAFIGIAVSHVFYYASIARLGVAVAGGVILLAPFITGVASRFLFQEQLTALQWISGTLAVIGAAAILRAQGAGLGESVHFNAAPNRSPNSEWPSTSSKC